MGIKIVVGGQYGGEGKGKVAHHIAKEQNIQIAVRIGGANSGHTVYTDAGEKLILRQLPTPSILPHSISVLGAGSYIDLDVLLEEIKLTKIAENQLLIDENAMVISTEDKKNESDLRKNIGSTQSGTGYCVIRRILRDKRTKLAKDYDELKPYICDTKTFLNEQLKRNKDILIEGTQGYGLSLLHSPHYPYTTSRDTTAAGFLSEVGLSPLDVTDIILVIRTYPIRVEGSSGILENEITWEELKQSPEFSSVTKKTRRVANIDFKIIQKAIISNRPTTIVLNHLDYIKEYERSQFITNLENAIDQKISYIGLSPLKVEMR